MTAGFLAERARYSTERLGALREETSSSVSGVAPPGLTIFAAGSFARLEAGEHSDVDLFFAYHPSSESFATRRTSELKLFGRLIEVVENLGFPPFSNDGQYLRTHNVEDILRHLGGPSDDAENYFTLRMLLILESKCVYGEKTYASALKRIIDSYYRDFAGNENTFQPWFLINDIMRYWKTLLLNYENHRAEEETDAEKIKRRVKNFKLRYSRMLTCFATIAALASYTYSPTQTDVYNLALLTPQERLRVVSENRSITKELISEILEEYIWFLTQTSLTKDELHAKFSTVAKREAMLSRAELFGQMLFDLLQLIDENRNFTPPLIRYLVI